MPTMLSDDHSLQDQTHASLDEMIRVEVLLALPERAWSVPLLLAAGSTVGDALKEAKPQLPSLAHMDWTYGIFGRLVSASMMLREGDRIELLRPLLADPMDQRRRRASKR